MEGQEDWKGRGLVYLCGPFHVVGWGRREWECFQYKINDYFFLREGARR